MNSVIRWTISLAMLALIACVLPLPARADIAVGNGGIGRLPANYTVLSTAGTYTLLNHPGAFLGVLNVNSIAQVTALLCYDNASAASGPVVFNSILTTTPPVLPDGGVSLSAGLTCNVSLSLLGSVVAVYYR
jgi:hypothetical protein